jgi:two-component system, OmpR family, sensor histidine kinase KdpD
MEEARGLAVWGAAGMLLRAAVRVLAVIVAVAVVTEFYFQVVKANTTTVALTYLITILVIATAWGLIEATVGSILATICFNYFFLPPIGTLTIADPRNWAALFAFLVTSIMASQLSARAKQRAREAVEREQEMEKLYALSCGILLASSGEPVAKQFAREIAATFGFPAVALYDRTRNETFRAGRYDLQDIDGHLREAAVQGTLHRDDARRLIVTSIRLGGEPIGSLAFSGKLPSDAALQSLANVVAVGLEKARVQEAANRAEAAREGQELRATLLDAIAHEFKTPLTSLKAATTALLSDPEANLRDYSEVIAIADQEVDRLTRQLTEAIHAARIESGEIRLNPMRLSAGAWIAGALEPMKPLTDGREVRIEVEDNLPFVLGDPQLLELALRQVIDNGLKYSTSDAPLAISARFAEGRLMIAVADQGPGIPERDLKRIFDLFYRGSRSRRDVTGTGMGLAIARQVLRAHGGDIGVRSGPGKGSEFILTIPCEARQRIA